MGSAVGSLRNVKIFVLYLMENINYPLDYITINDIVMQTDYVMYLDFALGFSEMLDGDLVMEVAKNENNEPLYAVTDKGRMIARELRSDILTSILDKSLESAMRYLDFRKRNVKAKCTYEEREDGSYDVHCSLTEQGRVILNFDLIVDTKNRAERMKDNFDSRPEVIYRGAVALLAGNMNYLFDK